MVSFTNVQMGSAGLYADPPTDWVGTDGLATCLGVLLTVEGQGSFVGHASCEVPVQGPGEEFAAVAEAMSALLTNALGQYSGETHTGIRLFSGGTDPALDALRAGVQLWSGLADIPFTAWDSFRVRRNGQYITWVRSSDTPEPETGPFAFDIPVPLEPGPEIPPAAVTPR